MFLRTLIRSPQAGFFLSENSHPRKHPSTCENGLHGRFLDTNFFPAYQPLGSSSGGACGRATAAGVCDGPARYDPGVSGLPRTTIFEPLSHIMATSQRLSDQSICLRNISGSIMQNYNANGSTRHQLVLMLVQVSDPKLRSSRR
jgi:hypothetical protein